ncbi:unnamed protein product [Rhizophagus irregularis]|uniref:Uncharacterized protein n=1 Tax=Rhizophagus irregularis TaxID=588596 RepID=A0A916EBZ0_9GLOM|nr:unnamed protein product [Rhizophagus irregularis]
MSSAISFSPLLNKDLANKSDKTLLGTKGNKGFFANYKIFKWIPKEPFLGVEAQQEVVNWFNANYNNNNDTDPVLIVIEWDVNTNLVQRTQIINHIQVNTTVAPQSNNNPSSTLFCVTGRDAGQTVEDAISAVRRNMFQRNGVVLARIFSIKAERKDLFEIIEHWDVFA